MIPRLKVCCIASLEEARLAVAHGADAVGLVGAMPSGPGTIADALSATIAAAVPPPVTAFLLTSQAGAKSIAEHAVAVGAGAVQIVRHIDIGEYRELRRLLPRTRLVQVVHVEGDETLDIALAYAEAADALLLDSGRPGAAVAELGGTGRTHDWAISRRIVERSRRPVFLAGGLTPANVRAAVDNVGPFGVDVCSGVRAGGHLDAAKLAAFAAALWGRPPVAGVNHADAGR